MSIDDRDAYRTVAAGRETLGAVLVAAQARLQRLFVAFVIGFLGTFYALQAFVWERLEADLFSRLGPTVAEQTAIVATTPFDVVLLQVKISLVVGVLLVLPAAVYYAREPLRERGLWPELSRRWIVGFGLASLALFFAGIAYAYVLFFPLLFQFLASNALGAGFRPTFSIVMWAQFVFVLALSSGLAAQLPLLMSTLAYAEIASYEFFRAKWRHAVLGTVVLGAMFNGTPEPFTMLLWAAPMIALYGVGLVATRFVERARIAPSSTASSTGATSVESAESAGPTGDPTAIDLGALDTAGIRAAPAAAFRAMSEDEALALASVAIEADDPEGAQAILDRFDEVRANDAFDEPGDGTGARAEGSLEPAVGERADSNGVFARTAAGMASAFSAEETTEEDIGGYYYDLRFVLDSLAAKSFRLVALFGTAFIGTFAFLYRGGIGAIERDFLARLPPTVAREFGIVVLHPVEALVFEVKLAGIVAVVVTLPLVVYYAWPALERRGLARGDRRVLVVWAVTLAFGLVVGSFVGYALVAPGIISWLVVDAVRAEMVIAYRVNTFGWLVFFTTVGVGLLAEIPLTMVLFHRSGLVTYRTLRGRWREVTIGVLAAVAYLSPQGTFAMFLFGGPILFAYGLGLVLVWGFAVGSRIGVRVVNDVVPRARP